MYTPLPSALASTKEGKRMQPALGSVARGSDQPVLHCADRRLAAGGCAQLVQDGRDMVGDGAVTDEQLLGDLPV